MRRYLTAAAILMSACPATAQNGPYHVITTAKVGGEGGWDYINADPVNRQLFIARSGQGSIGRITIYDLDTLKPLSTIPGTNAHGVAIDPKSHHGFATSKPVAMIDTKTLTVIKTIDAQGNPDGSLFDPYNSRVYIWSHVAPNATVINAADGSVVGTIDLGGAPEQAQSDEKGHIYVDIEDKNQVAVLDANAMKVTGTFDVSSKTTGLAGLALDIKNHILFVAGRNPAAMVVMNADNGKILASFPIGAGVDGAGFNPSTMEAFASTGGDGSLTVIKEQSPTEFSLEQTLPTMAGARTMTVDTKSNKVFVISAQRGPATPPDPSAPPGSAASRPRPGPIVADSFSILEIGK